MSAFIVRKETMDRAVDGILRGPYNDQPFNLEEATKLGQRLYELNTIAINGRYKERNPVPEYHFSLPHCSTISAYKAMECLHYQCSEEPAVNHPMYTVLTKAVAAKARAIVSSLPEYDKADWD